MARIKNNPLLKGLSGMLGDVIVYRETRGGMVMSNRPRKRGTPTEHQKVVKSKFLQAVQYAKAQMADPLTKAEYEASATGKITSGYAVAVADYLKGPEIISVNINAYNGQVGDVIDIIAIDNFKVTEVAVELRSASNEFIEEGIATQAEGNTLGWHYAATQPNAQAIGTKLIVRAKDKPGNITVKEFTLPIIP